MGTGYVRNDTANNIADGNVINASDLDGEFDAIQAAFNATTGHSHDGTTGEGPQIGTGGIADLAVTTGKIANDAVTLGTKTSGNYVATLATGAGLDGSASSEGATPTISLNLNELTTSVSDGDGDYFVVVDTLGAQKKLTKANIAVSGFNTANGIALGTDTTGNYIATGAVSGVGLSGSASAEGATFTVTSNATDANTASTIVARDASGNFSAGTITASLTGTASNAALLDSLDSTQFLRSDAADTKTAGDLSFSNNVKAVFGAGGDFEIVHTGTNTNLRENGTGNLNVWGDDIYFYNSAGTQTKASYVSSGAVTLYYNNSQKFATTSGGIDVTGTITFDGGTTSADLNFGDNDKAVFGAGSDLQIYHDGTNSRIADAGTGNLYIEADGQFRVIKPTTEEVMIKALTDGAVTLYYDNAEKLATTSSGIDVTGTAVTDGLTVAGNVSVDGGTIKLDGNYPTGTGNVALGNNALYNGSLSGGNNTAIGSAALPANTTGANNTALGSSCLYANTTGSQNTAVGRQALTSATTASDNAAVGYQALLFTTTGQYNTAVGTSALTSNTTASGNTAVGRLTLGNNTTGQYNTSLGYLALRLNTTASENTAVGYQAGYANTTGAANTAVGAYSLLATSTGNENVSVGRNSMADNTTGSSNSALGAASLADNTTGNNNTSVGYQSLRLNTTATRNTALGYQAGYSNTTGYGGVFVGQKAGYASATSNLNTMVGDNAGLNTTGAQNTFIGQGAGSTTTTGAKNTILGRYDGNQGGLDIRTSDNYIVLSDGDGNPRGYHTGSYWQLEDSVVAETETASKTGSQTADFNAYQNFVWTLTGNITLANPSTEKTGQSGFFIFIHSGAARTVSLGTDYETAGGAGLTLSSTSGAVDLVPYVVQSSGNILLGTPQLAFA